MSQLKLCKDCKNLSMFELAKDGRDFVKCLHHMSIYHISPVDGNHYYTVAAMFRGDGGTYMPNNCGPEAKYYDQRT